MFKYIIEGDIKMKVLVLCSGGLDSTTCLAVAVEKYGAENVLCLNMYYGQRHSKEIECAKNVCNYYNVPLMEFDLSTIFKDCNCSLLSHSNENIPMEPYSEQLKHTNGSPVTTYVPFRNGLFISVASSVAISHGCEVIYYGAHADDAAGNAYPDCSKEFNDYMNKAVYIGSGNSLNIVAPFVNNTKSEVVATGLKLNAPYHLTWSCYSGGEHPCGTCGTCRDRAEAFAKNNAVDPAL